VFIFENFAPVFHLHLNNYRHVLASQVWGTWSCTLGYPVMGIWGEGMGRTDIDCVARSADEKLVVRTITLDLLVKGAFAHRILYVFRCLETTQALLIW
jgi:hypothetical protein